jgi:hypothetical protein
MPDQVTALPHGGVRTLLRDMGGVEEDGSDGHPWTGQICLTDPGTGRVASLWVHHGAMYAAHLTGYVPPIAARLRSAGAIPPEQYSDYAAMRPEQAGPAAVTHLHASSETVETVHREVLLATVSHLYEWDNATWTWQDGARTDVYTTSGIPLLLIVAAVDERIGQWNAVMRTRPDVIQADMIPAPGPAWDQRTGVDMPTEMVTLLSMVDGRVTTAQIAATCGFTRFEIARLLAHAASANILVFSRTPLAQPELGMPGPPTGLPVLVDAPSPDLLIPVPLTGPAITDGRPDVTPADLATVWEDLARIRQTLTEVEAALTRIAAATRTDRPLLPPLPL